MIRVTPPLLLGVAAVVLLSGFGSCEVSCGKRKLDPEKAESAIRDFFGKAQISVTKASCPERIEAKTDKTVTCTATVENGDILEVEITIRDGGFEITRFDNAVSMTKVEAKIAEMVEGNPTTRARKIAAATCPPDKKAVAGATSRCTAAAGDGTGFLFDVVENDDSGNINIKFAGVAVQPASLAKQLQAMLDRKSIQATVDCGGKPVSLVEKIVVSCVATDNNGKTASLEIQPTSAYGDFDWRIVANK